MWLKESRCVWRDGKPYQTPTPAQVGDVITVECAVFWHGYNVAAVHGHTDYDVQQLRQLYTATFVSTVEVNIPRSLLQPVELPPVTATPA